MASLSEAFPNINTFERPQMKNYFNSQDNLFLKNNQQKQNNYIQQIEITDNVVRQLFANPLFREWLSQSILNMTPKNSGFINTCQNFFIKNTVSCLIFLVLLFSFILILLAIKK